MINKFRGVSLSIILVAMFSWSVGASAKSNKDAGLDVHKATYKVGKNELEVKGTFTLATKGNSKKSGKSNKDSKGHSAKAKDAQLVELWDVDLGLQLAVTNLKGSNFKFKLPLGSQTTAPCNIEVRIDGQSVEKSVKRAPVNCGSYLLTLTGLVTDAPVPFATVSVTIGGNTYTTIADEYGAYTLDILSTSVGQLLIIEASAINEATGAPIDFVNLAGTFSRLLSDPEANVTNVTTASYILAVEANGGEVPASLEELQTAETSIDATELIELAAVIKLVVDDPDFGLPVGYDSILDFIADETAVETFIAEVEAVDPEALTNVQTEILQDSDLVAGFTLDDIPSRYYAIPVANPGYMARTGSALEFDTTNNTGRFLSFAGYNGQPINESYNWTINEGRLEFTFPDAQPVEEFAGEIEELTDIQLEIDAYYAGGGIDFGIPFFRTVTQRNYTRVVDGSLVDVIASEERSELETPELTLNNGSTLQLANTKFVIETRNELFRSEQDIETIPFTTSCLETEVCALGVWGGVFHYSEGLGPRGVYPDTSYGEVITFSTGGTAIGAISNRSATWVVDAQGRLVITYLDGLVQTLTIIDNKGIEYGVFSTFVNGNENYASYNLWVRGDESFQLSESYLLPSSPNRYWNGEINSWRPGSIDASGAHTFNNRFGWQFLENNQVDNFYINLGDDFDGDGDPDNGLVITHSQGWTIESGVALIDRFSYARRYWFPIASTVVNGERIFYVIEREERDEALWYGGDPGAKTFIPSRMNIEREIEEYTDWDYTTEQGPW